MKNYWKIIKLILFGTFVIWFSTTNTFAALARKVKVSSNDATSGFLNGKLVAGNSVSFTEGNDGGNETLTIAALGSEGSASNQVFLEGATEDDFETILDTDDPTADRTFNFPDDDIAAGDILVGDAANSLAYVGLADTEIIVGDGTGAPANVSLSGDATMTNAGVVTVADDSHAHVYSNIDATTSANWASQVSDETGSGAWVFADGPTLSSPALGTITSGVGTALTALNGENIQDDTIDDDSIDFTDVTGADITLTDAGPITSSGTITAAVGFDCVGAADCDYGSVDITDHTFITDGTGTAEMVFPAGSVDSTEILDDTIVKADFADEDWGDVSVATNSVTLDDDVVAPAEMADADHGDFTYTAGVAAIDANAVTLSTDTTGNFVATIADAGNTTVTVANSGTENAAVTLDVVDLNCTDCIGETEISDTYLVNNADDVTTGGITVGDITGVKVSGATGVLTFASVGNTNNENLTIDLETTANRVDIASGTAVDLLTLDAKLYLKTTTLDADIGTAEMASSGSSAVRPQAVLIQTGAGTNPAQVRAYKTRSTSATGDANTTVVTGDSIFGMEGYAADGTDYKQAASIVYSVEGTVATDRVPGKIVLSTAADAVGSALTPAITIDSNQATTFTGKVNVPQEDGATTPTLNFGDGDSGFYEKADDSIYLSLGGALQYKFQTSWMQFGSSGGNAGIMKEITSATNPVFVPVRDDADTGLGSAALDQLSLISGGIEGIRITETASAITNLLVGTTQFSSTTGVSASGTSGVLTLAGIGNTNNEDLTFDFEATANQVNIDSSTGVTALGIGPDLLINTTSNQASAMYPTIVPIVQIVNTGSTFTGVVIHQSGGAAAGYWSQLILSSSRNSTYGSSTANALGDVLGKIQFQGDDGTDYNTNGLNLAATVDAAVGANSIPTKLSMTTTSGNVAFEIGSDRDAIFGNSVGGVDPLAQLHIDQSSTTAAQPVLLLDQADVDEDFIKIIGTSDTNVDRSLVDAVDFTTPGSIVGWIKINVQDDQGTNPITDGDYYIPFYAAPSA